MRKIVIFFSLLIFFSVSFAETLEERVKLLENKVRQLEKRIEKLEKSINSETPVEKEKNVENIPIPQQESPVIKVKSPEEIVDFKVLKKRFEKASLKESLWNRYDQIILTAQIKNKLNKELSAIIGKVVILDKNGNPLMETRLNVNKALNFFSGMTIKPGETLKYKVYFKYDSKNPKHRFVKDASLDDLVIKFYPTEIDFADGTKKQVEYVR